MPQLSCQLSDIYIKRVSGPDSQTGSQSHFKFSVPVRYIMF